MSDSQKICPKCKGEMKKGFIVGIRQMTGAGPIEWVEGSPGKGTFSPLSLLFKVKTTTITYACASCGYLESYLDDCIPRIP